MDITLSDWIWLYVAVYKFIYRCRIARTIASLPALCFIPIGNTEVAGCKLLGVWDRLFIFILACTQCVRM